jgi:hypothetical protein
VPKKGRSGKLFSGDELLAGLLAVAQHLGRSPSQGDLGRLSAVGQSFCPKTYQSRFGTFNKAKALVGLASRTSDSQGRRSEYKLSGKRKDMPRRLRFRVLHRDNFRCTYCGATPEYGARLVIDHATPVSAGGRAEMSNLRTACCECNAGKAAEAFALEAMVLSAQREPIPATLNGQGVRRGTPPGSAAHQGFGPAQET